TANYSAKELHQLLLSEVRDEFNHNLSQQIYFSDEAWESVKNAIEQVVTMINRASQDLNDEARGIDLNKRIFQLYLEKKNDSISIALKNIKSEIRIYFSFTPVPVSITKACWNLGISKESCHLPPNNYERKFSK